MIRRTSLVVFAGVALLTGSVFADPCGMVPPIYPGKTVPLARVGEQRTYVFYEDGIESFAIKPGFTGKVEEFGMLIPFPTPPAIRKLSDNVFEHVAAAIDPPEVVVDLRLRLEMLNDAQGNSNKSVLSSQLRVMKESEVRVLREEAVGMYEVAVLEAGSAAALNKWMEAHGYKYPAGMDAPCNEYVKAGWCFVAVKTQVGAKSGVNPQPGQREVQSKLPAGAAFDGYVQAMGFRFQSDELVVPMRLSAFNDGDLRNIVYLLTDSPKKIRAIPEEYVVRQVSGDQLLKNLTEPLPLRIIGGVASDIPPYRRKTLTTERDPTPRNGIAKELFAADLLAVAAEELSLPHEEEEKVLLRIGEKLGLRGAEIDQVNERALSEKRETVVKKGLAHIDELTLTVVDGDFPRELLASQNLQFSEYRMPNARNSQRIYDAKTKAPGVFRDGVLKTGAIDYTAPMIRENNTRQSLFANWFSFGGIGLLFAIALLATYSRFRR